MENENNIDNEMTNEVVEETTTPKKKNKRKIIIIVIVVVAILLLALLIGKAMSSFSANMQDQMNAMMGESEAVYTVERQDVEQEITTSGNVIGIETKAYTSPVNAKVDDIKVEVGQIVKKGDVLLTYDASELGDNLEKVKIQAESERAAGNESFEQANKAAGKASKANKKADDLKEDIRKLKKEIEKLNKKIAEYEEKMSAAKATTDTSDQEEASSENGESGDASSSNTGLTLAEEKAYKKALSDLQKKTESLSAKQAALEEQKSIAAANEEITVSESTKAQVNANNKLSDMNVNDAQESYDAAEAGITAKEDGIVASIDVVKGSYASETQTLLTIIDAEQIGVEFTVSKDDLGSISSGQKARVVISGHEYEGNVEFVSRVATLDTAMASGSNATSGGTIKGRILLDNPDENIYIGVSAKAYIFVGKSENALTIPYEALCSDIDGDYVYVVNDENLIERKDVKIGIYSDEYYEVLEGISEGDKVIRNVTSDMKPGDTYVEGNAAMAGMPGME